MTFTINRTDIPTQVGINFLYDCGWNEDITYDQFSMNRVELLSKYGCTFSVEEYEFETEEQYTMFLLRWG